MPLWGSAAVVIWSRMADAADHDDWHSHEHLPERIGVDGFLRARRWVAQGPGDPHALVLYEVAEAAVMTSPAYLARLNEPTPWSRRMMAANRGLNRTLCRVAASFGTGAGGLLASLPLASATLPSAARPALHQALASGLAGLAMRPGLVAAHLLLRDSDRARPATTEERLRGSVDESVEGVLLLEGYDAASLDRAAAEMHRRAQAEAVPLEAPRLYTLAHLVVRGDAGGPR